MPKDVQFERRASSEVENNELKGNTQPDEKFVYHSEWLTAAALTQTYVYIIENGLEYSKLVTGEADIFL